MTPETDGELERARQIARWADNRYIDPVLGLVLPGAGDLAGALLGLWAVTIALRRGVSKIVVARMLLNLGVDAAAGAVPILGDVWDFFFKAHARNLELLRARLGEEQGRRARPSDWLAVIGAAVLFVAALALPFVLLVLAVRAII